MPFKEAKHIPLEKSGGTSVDHLCWPKGWTGKPVDILFVCSEDEQFDYVSFKTYPTRMGWSEDDLFDPLSSGKSTKDIKIFFQKWLFFVFLFDTLRMPIDPTDFVEMNEQGQLIITTTCLFELIERWRIRDQYLSYRAQERHAVRVAMNLQRICDIMCSWNDTGRTPLDKWSTVYTGMLCQWFDYLNKLVYFKVLPTGSVRELFDSDENIRTPSWFGMSRNWTRAVEPGESVLKEEMLGNGWCRSDITRYFSTMPIHGVYFTSLLSPPGSEKEPNPTKLKQKHWQCSNAACNADDCEGDYRSMHVFDNCACSHIGVANQDVIRVLEQDKVPLIRIGPGITVVSANSRTQYVAISHVWSDGLGNPVANTLPWCQVLKIANLVDQLNCSPNQPILFWIDTLCCPISPSTARKRAIRLMRRTYREASMVLVLESYIQSRSSTITNVELLATIWCSKWSRRLWTLSERILAQDRLYFRFKDRTLWLEAIITSQTMTLKFIPKDSEGLGLMLFWEDVDSRFGFEKLVYNRSSMLLDIHKSSKNAVAIILTLLSFRSTSKSSDEPLCVGALLDLDMKKINDVDENARMEAMWSIIPEIPPEIVFLRGERLATKGFRWAPKTFLLCPPIWKPIDGNYRGAAVLGPEGLTVRYPAWILGCARNHKIAADNLYMFEADGSMYSIRCSDKRTLESYTVKSTINPWDLATPQTLSDAAVYLIVRSGTGQITGGGKEHEAVLVLNSAMSAGTFRARFVCTASFIKLDKTNRSVHEATRAMRNEIQKIPPQCLLRGDWCLMVDGGSTTYATGGTLITNKSWTID